MFKNEKMKVLILFLYFIFNILSVSAQVTYTRTEIYKYSRDVKTIKKYPTYELIEKIESFDKETGQLTYFIKYYYERRVLKRSESFNGKGELTGYLENIYNEDTLLIQTMDYRKWENGNESLIKKTLEYNNIGKEVKSCSFILNPLTQESKHNYPSHCFYTEYDIYGNKISYYGYDFDENKDGSVKKRLNDSIVYIYDNRGFQTTEIEYNKYGIHCHTTNYWKRIGKSDKFFTYKIERIYYDISGNYESKNVSIYDNKGILEENKYKYFLNEFVRENYWHR